MLRSETCGIIPHVYFLICFFIKLQIKTPGSHRGILSTFFNKSRVNGPLRDKIFKLFFLRYLFGPIEPVPNIVIGLKLNFKNLFQLLLITLSIILPMQTQSQESILE